MNIIKHTFRELGRQPIVGTVSVIGTAFTIFLIMTMVVIDRVKFADFAPESNRSRMLVATGVNIYDEEGRNRSTLYSPGFLEELYSGIDGIEAFTIFSGTPTSTDVSVPGKAPMNVNKIWTDDDYWRVFDFEFLSGKPYRIKEVTWDDLESCPVIITESVARHLFGSTDVAGRTILVGRAPRRVGGVVRDVSPLASYAYAQLWAPFRYERKGPVMGYDDAFGQNKGVALARDKSDIPAIRREVEKRYEAVNRRFKPMNLELLPHGQPYTVKQASTIRGTNSDPDDDALWWVPYVVLLLVPAINLSSMTNSLLRRRRTEIGVRRAFGATRASVTLGIFNENLVVTIIGAAIGLLVSWLFIWLWVGYFVSSNSWERLYVEPSISPQVLFSWATFGIAAGCSLVLNFLSAGLPSWLAARRDPVDALSGHEK